MSSGNDTAVLVIDLIEDYFDERLWPESVIPSLKDKLVRRVNLLVAAHRERGASVFWINQEFNPDLSDAFPHMVRADRWYAMRGTAGAELLDGLDCRKDDVVISKTRFSAFFETRLREELKAREIRNLVIAGITTSWCVRSTATDAYQLGFNIELVQDCLAAFREEDHWNALREMTGFIATSSCVEPAGSDQNNHAGG